MTVIASNAITLVPLNQQLASNGTFTASFQGNTGLIYSVDRAPNVAGPWQSGFTNIQVGTNGTFTIVDPGPSLAPVQFYRVHYP